MSSESDSYLHKTPPTHRRASVGAVGGQLYSSAVKSIPRSASSSGSSIHSRSVFDTGLNRQPHDNDITPPTVYTSPRSRPDPEASPLLRFKRSKSTTNLQSRLEAAVNESPARDKRYSLTEQSPRRQLFVPKTLCQHSKRGDLAPSNTDCPPPDTTLDADEDVFVDAPEFHDPEDSPSGEAFRSKASEEEGDNISIKKEDSDSFLTAVERDAAHLVRGQDLAKVKNQEVTDALSDTSSEDLEYTTPLPKFEDEPDDALLKDNLPRTACWAADINDVLAERINDLTDALPSASPEDQNFNIPHHEHADELGKVLPKDKASLLKTEIPISELLAKVDTKGMNIHKRMVPWEPQSNIWYYTLTKILPFDALLRIFRTGKCVAFKDNKADFRCGHSIRMEKWKMFYIIRSFAVPDGYFVGCDINEIFNHIRTMIGIFCCGQGKHRGYALEKFDKFKADMKDILTSGNSQSEGTSWSMSDKKIILSWVAQMSSLPDYTEEYEEKCQQSGRPAVRAGEMLKELTTSYTAVKCTRLQGNKAEDILETVSWIEDRVSSIKGPSIQIQRLAEALMERIHAQLNKKSKTVFKYATTETIAASATVVTTSPNSLMPTRYTTAREIGKAIHKTLRRGLTVQNHRPGQLYMLRSRSKSGSFKIGVTKGRPQKRCSNISYSCKICDLELDVDGVFPTKLAHLVEHLVHLELDGQIEGGACNGCEVHHREWFRVKREDARAVIMKWVEWAEKDPYEPVVNEDGHLSWSLNGANQELLPKLCAPFMVDESPYCSREVIDASQSGEQLEYKAEVTMTRTVLGVTREDSQGTRVSNEVEIFQGRATVSQPRKIKQESVIVAGRNIGLKEVKEHSLKECPEGANRTDV
ncbi:hypothetical protein UCRPC4_g00672 [Phaeomoniella chlamydospora]|uniref:Bacteriophage T5 Orf172 DNA-binding domain-containing protein n=1 Tax=Phaeomoniella chlamydospora TaxID=158046 RepID=A0A0G2EZS6_PHACM|nr:hypothetical protein UCRPC4_g00672 [Phaeomoniella chlamydospora]